MTDSDCLAQFDYAAVRQEFARQNAQKRRFAATRGTDDGEYLAFVDGKRDVLQYLGAPEALARVLDRDERLLFRGFGHSAFSLQR